MLIDWFTVGAQAINFLVLVWLLKRFLYRPVLDAIDRRERQIAAALQDAAAKAEAAGKERADLEGKNREFESRRAGLLSQAAGQAESERQKLLDSARAEAAALRARLAEAAKAERASLDRELAARTQAEVLGIAGQALADLAGAGLEERIAAVFVQRLRALDAGEKARLAAPSGAAESRAVVRSAFALAPAERAEVESAVKALLPAGSRIDFEADPALVSGIELAANGRKLDWSAAGYLAALQRSVGRFVDEHYERAERT